MAAVAERKLSLEEFHARYGGEKPYFEYQDGEAVQKSMPTKLHSLIEWLLVGLLYELGFDAGLEIRVKLDPANEPVPDVIAAEKIGDPYPTENLEVAIEILSPDDTFSRVLQKCRLYSQWGIRQIRVIDPLARQVFSFENGALGETDIIARRGTQSISATELWRQVDLKLNRSVTA